jgi:hypothetical protein
MPSKGYQFATISRLLASFSDGGTGRRFTLQNKRQPTAGRKPPV